MSTVLVTGANRGIGLGLVRATLARQGKYPLILATCRQKDSDELGELVSRYPSRVKRILLRDVGDEESVLEAVKCIQDLAPNGINILINNAGDATRTDDRLPALNAALHYRKLLITNAYGPLLFTSTLWEHGLLRAPVGAGPKTPNFPATDLSSKFSEPSATPAPPESGQERGERSTDTDVGNSGLPNVPIVVNMSSLQGSLTHVMGMWQGGPTADELVFHPIYAATKVALSGATMHLAREMRNDAIVNCVHPGWVKGRHARSYAKLSPEDAGNKILDLVEGWRSTRDSGRWYDEEGRIVPW